MRNEGILRHFAQLKPLRTPFAPMKMPTHAFSAAQRAETTTAKRAVFVAPAGVHGRSLERRGEPEDCDVAFRARK